MKHPMEICIAELSDLEDILKLQKIAYLSEAEIYDDFEIPPLKQTLKELEKDFELSKIFVTRESDEIIGSINLRIIDGTGYITRLVVHPNYQGKGIGSRLLKYAEEVYPEVCKIELFTGHKSLRNLKLYNKHGYKEVDRKKIHENLTEIYFQKDKNR